MNNTSLFEKRAFSRRCIHYQQAHKDVLAIISFNWNRVLEDAHVKVHSMLLSVVLIRSLSRVGIRPWRLFSARLFLYFFVVLSH